MKVGDHILIHKIQDEAQTAFTRTIWPSYINKTGIIRRIVDPPRCYWIKLDDGRPDFFARIEEIILVNNNNFEF